MARSGRDELRRLSNYVDEGAVAHDGDRQRPAYRVTEHQLLQVLGSRDRMAASRDQQVASAQPSPGRRAAGNNFGDSQATGPPEPLLQLRWQGGRHADDAQVRAANMTVSHQCTDDLARR